MSMQKNISNRNFQLNFVLLNFKKQNSIDVLKNEVYLEIVLNQSHYLNKKKKNLIFV